MFLLVLLDLMRKTQETSGVRMMKSCEPASNSLVLAAKEVGSILIPLNLIDRKFPPTVQLDTPEVHIDWGHISLEKNLILCSAPPPQS